MQKITRNTFSKGLNTDLESGKISPEQYTEAHNIELVGDGAFLAAKNIKGTSKYDLVTNADGAEVIGTFENNYKINGVTKKCLTIFTMEDYTAIEADPVTYVLTGIDTMMYKSEAAGNKTIVAASGTYNLGGNTMNNDIVYQYLAKGLEYSGLDACANIDLSSGGFYLYSTESDLSTVILNSTVFYTDVTLLSPFSGLGVGSFYKIKKVSGVTTTYSTEINGDGTMYSLDSCV